MLPWRNRRISHGRIMLPIKRTRAVITRTTRLISKNKPRGSLAKEAGRKASKRGIVIKANGSSKGPREAGRC